MRGLTLRLRAAPLALLVMVVAGALPAGAQRADAQRVVNLQAGSQLRVHLQGPPRVVVRSTLLGADSTTLLLTDPSDRARAIPRLDPAAIAPGGPRPFEVAMAEVRRVEERDVRRSAGGSFLRGAGTGAAIGVGITALAVVVGLIADAQQPRGEYDIPTALVGLVAGTALTVVTSTVGGFVGLTRRERWRTVYVAPAPVDTDGSRE